MASDAGRDEYLTRVLDLDPADDLHLAVSLRRERAASRRQGAEGDGAAVDVDELRRVLDAVSEQLLDGDVDDLRGRLEALELDAHPGLEHRRARLFDVLAARPEVERAFADPRSSKNFVRFVRTLLCANGEQAADLKRRAVTTLRSKARATEARKTLRHWKARYPRLYALERVWFEEEAIETTRRLNGMSLGIVVAVVVYALLQSLRFFRD